MDKITFDDKRIASGYAKDRLWLHPNVIDMMKKRLQIDCFFANGLDIGCGAGLSTKALKMICHHVTGVDVSAHMIEVCRESYPDEAYDFFVSCAEHVVSDKKFDIVTAAGVINWVEEDEFFNNLKDILQSNAIICIYDFWITSKMPGSAAFTEWWQASYLDKFPKPYRKENKWTQDHLPEGYQMTDQIDFSFSHKLNKDSLIRFMMTQSNVNCKIATGAVTKRQVRGWFDRSLEGIFSDNREEREIVFDGYLWCIKCC